VTKKENVNSGKNVILKNKEEELESIKSITDEQIEPLKKDEINRDNIVQIGDFIKVEIVGKVIETGEVFETTDAELARVEGIYKENMEYGPKLVVVGEGWVLKGLDNKLSELKEGEKKEIEISSEEAFGVRDSSNIQMVPYRVLRSKGINPVVGQELEIDGRTAIIRSIGGGRVQIDYNHPLAGRDIIYEVKATNILKDKEEKLRALIGRRFMGIESKEFDLRELKKRYRIQIPDKIFFGENIQIAKRGLALDILNFFPELESIEYMEVIKRSK
jgi:peptidylprolyl isomerase